MSEQIIEPITLEMDAIFKIADYPVLIKKGTVVYSNPSNSKLIIAESQRQVFPSEFRYDPMPEDGEDWKGDSNE